MLDRLKKLIDVKSILTLILTIIFSILCLREIINPETFIRLYELIIVFYFGTQNGKSENGKKEEK
jgi:hypothetical protein